MPAPPTLARRLALALALLPLLPSAGGAEPRDESTRWVPAIGFRSGLLGQNASADVVSGNVIYQRTTRERVFRTRPPPQGFFERVTTQNINTQIRPGADGDDLLLTPFVGGTLELMTPGLQMLPGRPRLFVRGDTQAAFATTRHIARERAPSALPPGNPIVLDPAFIEDAVEGIGSETTAEVQPLAISAGAGVAFSFDLFGRRVRIKPSAEYLREEIDFEGSVVSAQLSDTGINAFPPNIPLPKPSLFIPITIRGSKSEVFEGVGAGLELELDAARAGPFMLSLFAGAQGVKLLGDREVEFSSTTRITNAALRPNPQDVSASWSFEKDPWSYSGGIGVRFRWLPEWE
jgi:hypothetical protein